MPEPEFVKSFPLPEMSVHVLMSVPVVPVRSSPLNSNCKPDVTGLVSNPLGEADELGDCEWLGDTLAEGELDADGDCDALGLADPEGDTDGDVDVLGLSDADVDPDGLGLPLGLTEGDADELGDVDGLADGDAEADGDCDADGDWLKLAAPILAQTFTPFVVPVNEYVCTQNWYVPATSAGHVNSALLSPSGLSTMGLSVSTPSGSVT